MTGCRCARSSPRSWFFSPGCFSRRARSAPTHCERACNEIPESVAEPILVFVCVFPILVAVYVVYHDFKSIREDLKKVKELELVRAEARRRLSQVKGAAMATMALAATKSPSKRYAPGTGEESATSGELMNRRPSRYFSRRRPAAPRRPLWKPAPSMSTRRRRSRVASGGYGRGGIDGERKRQGGRAIGSFLGLFVQGGPAGHKGSLLTRGLPALPISSQKLRPKAARSPPGRSGSLVVI